MGRSPCCEENGLKKGPWTPEEDEKLVQYIQNHGLGSWRALPRLAGLNRCGKSCRLRWTNYLRPDIKRGKFSEEEEQTILHLHSILGNKWSTIATHLPGRTDNEIKNFWNTHLKKKLIQMGFDPMTHQPRTDLFSSLTNLIALANLRDQVQSLVDKQLYHPLMDLQLINNINNNNILVPQNDSNHQQLVINSLMNSVSHVSQPLESRGSLVVPNNLAEYYHINGAISDPQPLHYHHQHDDHRNVNASNAHAQPQQDVSFGSQPFSLNSMSTSSCHPDEIVLMSGDYHDHDHDDHHQHHDGGGDSASWFDHLPNLMESDDQYDTLAMSNNNNVVDSIYGGENTTTTATTTSTSNCLWSQTYF